MFRFGGFDESFSVTRETILEGDILKFGYAPGISNEPCFVIVLFIIRAPKLVGDGIFEYGG